MNKKHKLINEILSNWDPIGLPKKIAEEEYLGYVQSFFVANPTEESTVEKLHQILEDLLSVKDEKILLKNKMEIKDVAKKIVSVLLMNIDN